MSKYSTVSRTGQAISGAVLLSIAIATGVTGLSINVAHGWQVSLAAAVLFGLADLTKITLPIVCGVIGWTRQTRITALVCVAVSLWCVFTGYQERAGQNIAAKQHGADQYMAAQVQVAKLEIEVKDLDAQAAAEARKGGCGKQCKYLDQRADERRAELTEAKQGLKVAKPVAIAGSENMKAEITAGMYLFLIEALIWLSVPAMQCLSAARRKPEAKATIRKSRTVAKPKQKQDWTKVESYATAPRLTKAGKIDGRSKAARAVKRVTNTKLVMPA